jgi:hypothetical protein
VYTERVEAGRRVGKYVLDERIAVGGMAEVWAAHAEGREGFVKPVALKFILESFSGDPELERLFVNEARIAARLQHANLVTVFDFDKVDADAERGLAGRYYIAMERVEGQDLRRLFEAARRVGAVFPLGVALHVAGEVLKALRYVHERRDAGGALGLVHRDVSPHNVLVGYTGEVKLSDFGIAKAREHSARQTKPGSLRGKIGYASPEQLAGGVIDHRTDQFAAGVTIWELLAGRKLFDGSSDLETIGKVARCAIPPLGEVRRDVPAAVEAVVRRMLAAEPSARFARTAEALSAVLALSGYSPDGAALGELVRALFASSRAGRSTTLPLNAVVPASGPAAVTRTMGEAGAAPSAAETSANTPTRAAKRVSEALARSPSAAAGGEEGHATVDVRSRPSAARIVGAVVFGAALAAGVLARRQLGFGAGAGTRVSATSPTSGSPSPPGAGRRPTPPVPPPSAVVAAPPREAPTPAPRVADAPPTSSRAPAPLEPAPPFEIDHVIAEPGATKTPSAARGAADHRQAAHRHVAASAEAAPAIAAPAPQPRAVEPPPPSPLKTSAHGAPIIE